MDGLDVIRAFYLSLLVAILGFCFLDQRSDSNSKKTLMLAHNLDSKHPVHLAMEYMAEELFKNSGGSLKIQIYPSAQLGAEREVLELLQLGVLAMTKVSSMSLENFSPAFSILNLPYVFDSKEHYFRVLDSHVGEEILLSPQDKRLLGLSYYDSGARSFYAKKAILKPEDLKGLKIRVMGSQTAIRMVQLLGGSPTPMPYGEIYTALQQGVIDGAESNITALSLGRHGEVIKNFSMNEHSMLPDVLLIGRRVWERLSEQERAWLKEAAEKSKLLQRKLWAKEIERAMKVATEEMNVEIQYPNKFPFVEKVLPMHKDFLVKHPQYKEWMQSIHDMKHNVSEL